jgi:hypothetical protein
MVRGETSAVQADASTIAQPSPAVLTTPFRAPSRCASQPRKRVKPFIDKKDAESFLVMHRSQQDPKYHEDGASKYVLVSTKARLPQPAYSHAGSVAGGGDEDDDGAGGDDGRASVATGVTAQSARGRGRFTDRMYDAASVAESAAGGSRRGGRGRAGAPAQRRVGNVLELAEVDEMGFPLDGYDYNQHFREMGSGGVFMAAANGVHLSNSLAQRIDLPADVLPSRPEDELDRMLEAITLKPTSLPSDIRAVMEALEEADDDEEEDDDEDGDGGQAGGGAGHGQGGASQPRSGQPAVAAAGPASKGKTAPAASAPQRGQGVQTEAPRAGSSGGAAAGGKNGSGNPRRAALRPLWRLMWRSSTTISSCRRSASPKRRAGARARARPNPSPLLPLPVPARREVTRTRRRRPC